MSGKKCAFGMKRVSAKLLKEKFRRKFFQDLSNFGRKSQQILAYILAYIIKIKSEILS